MKILIVGDFLFPFGSASASRMRLYSRGLTEAGATVRVISQNELYDRPDDVGGDGQRRYYGVSYESVLGYSGRHKEKRTLRRKLLWFRNYVLAAGKVARRAAELVESESFDVIVQYSRSYLSISPLLKICKAKHIALIHDIVEWPNRHFFRGGILHPLYADTKLAMYLSLAQSDGIVGISEFLTNFYADRGIPAICIPAMVEIPADRPEPREARSKNGEFNITYLGSLGLRDGPFEMTAAIRNVLEKGLAAKFTIVGSSGVTGTALKVRQMCEKDALLRDKVEFLGRVSDDEVTRRLGTADVLLFVRPDDLTARAAFPTRLPEYLVSGTPVIAAGVGDIPIYLRDGVDAMVVKPCTAENIAGKIESLMKMPDRGLAIGRSGFERASECFNYKARTAEIARFIEKVASNKKSGRH